MCLPLNITVPLHFTVFTTNFTTASLVNNSVLEEQVKRTNDAFRPVGIQFFISTLSYHVGEEWRSFTQHRDDEANSAYVRYSEAIKTQNRYGGNDEANIWVVEQIDKSDCDTGVYQDGYCTFARNLKEKGHPVDGCVLDMDSLPGVAFKKYAVGKGDTLTHELGHWFDLGEYSCSFVLFVLWSLTADTRLQSMFSLMKTELGVLDSVTAYWTPSNSPIATLGWKCIKTPRDSAASFLAARST